MKWNRNACAFLGEGQWLAGDDGSPRYMVIETTLYEYQQRFEVVWEFDSQEQAIREAELRLRSARS